MNKFGIGKSLSGLKEEVRLLIEKVELAPSMD